VVTESWLVAAALVKVFDCSEESFCVHKSLKKNTRPGTEELSRQ
jgi:hypothetical protein